jgi:8-oxo-dGTP diphosphatase
LINKEDKVWIGRWNGVGGKLKEKETPEECIIREIKEETGIAVSHVTYKGVVTWARDSQAKGGMYLFLVELPLDYVYETPIKNREGILDWKAISWILHPENKGLADTLPNYLPIAMSEEGCYEHFSIFDDEKIIKWNSAPIATDVYPIK